MKLFSPVWALATAAVVNAQSSPPSDQPSPLVTQSPEPSAIVSEAPSSSVNTESTRPSAGVASGVPSSSVTLASQPSLSPTSLSSEPTGQPTPAPTLSTQPSATASGVPSNLPTLPFQPSDQPTSKVTLSSRPSDVSSNMPTYIPTESKEDMGPPYDACPICGDGEVIGNPSFELPGTGGQTCASANAAGLAGNIMPDSCAPLQLAGPSLCSCGAISAADTAAPTASPVAGTVISPSSGECGTDSCTLVPVWDQLQGFVDAASDGDLLCMCGRFYEGGTCGTATITTNSEKEVTFECAPTQICSFNCPQSAFVVNTGTLVLQGTEQNFVLTGGSTLSRVVVGAEGGLVADQIAFEK